MSNFSAKSPWETGGHLRNGVTTEESNSRAEEPGSLLEAVSREGLRKPGGRGEPNRGVPHAEFHLPNLIVIIVLTQNSCIQREKSSTSCNFGFAVRCIHPNASGTPQTHKTFYAPRIRAPRFQDALPPPLSTAVWVTTTNLLSRLLVVIHTVRKQLGGARLMFR